jgi:hypothetical protein
MMVDSAASSDDSALKTQLLQEALIGIRDSVVFSFSNAEQAITSSTDLDINETTGFRELRKKPKGNIAQEAKTSWVDTKPKYSGSDLDNVFTSVLSRNQKLGGYIKQLVRVVRLASIISGNKPFEEFFFSGSAQISARYFERVINDALRSNRIPSTLISFGEDQVETKQGSRTLKTIEFIEPAMATTDASSAKTDPFKISYGNIPPVAATFEVLWYVLGSDTLQSILSPVLAREINTRGVAEKVSQHLVSVVTSWLDGAIGKSDASRQAVIIQRFLVGQRMLKAGVMSDDTIFDFWLAHARSDDLPRTPDYSDKGFKRFRSAATCMLRFERAMSLNSSASPVPDKRPAKQDARSKDEGGEVIDRSRRFEHHTPPDDPRDYFKPKSPDVLGWRSPVIPLFSPPRFDSAPPRATISPVKWLNRDQLKLLNNYIHGCSDALEGSVSEADETDVHLDIAKDRSVAHVIAYSKLDALDPDSGALMGTDRFNLRFNRTLLRADLFVPVQNDITQALRIQSAERKEKGEPPIAGIDAAEIRSFLPRDTEGGYSRAAARYAEVCLHLNRTALASIWHFALRSRHSAAVLDPETLKAVLTLVAHIGSKTVFDFFRGPVFAVTDKDEDEDEDNKSIDSLLQRYEPRVRAALDIIRKGDKTKNPEIDKFVWEVRDSRNQRIGFKDKDAVDEDIQEAHTQGALHLVSLLDEVMRLDNALKKIRPEAYIGDREKFARAFEQIYSG